MFGNEVILPPFFSQTKLLVGYNLGGGGGGGGGEGSGGRGGGIATAGSLGLLSYDTRTDAEPLVLDELGCREGCSAFGQSTQAREDRIGLFVCWFG